MAQASGSRPHHVVFIGDTGSGKSSVINLVLGHDLATVSPDAKPCTSTFTSYDVSLGGRTYRLWDTPGLNSPSGLGRLLGRRGSRVNSLKRFLQERHRHRELDLLVLCIQGSRATNVMSKAYRDFCRETRRIAPVVIAITCLERKQPAMDAWWDENERGFRDLGRASQEDIRILVSAEYRTRGAGSAVSEREYLSHLSGDCVIC